MNQKVSYFLLVTNLILIFIVIFLWWSSYDVKIVISQQDFLKNYETYKDIDGIVDAITYAQQLGRLDVISLILSMFGILIGIFAIGWFGFVKEMAKQDVNSIMNSQEIKDMIENTSRQKAEEILSSGEMREYLSNRMSSLSNMTDNSADDISASI